MLYDTAKEYWDAKKKREEQQEERRNNPEQRALDAEVERKAQMRLDYALAILASGGLPELNRQVASGELAAWADANGLHGGPPPPRLRKCDLISAHSLVLWHLNNA